MLTDDIILGTDPETLKCNVYEQPVSVYGLKLFKFKVGVAKSEVFHSCCDNEYLATKHKC